MKLGLSGELNNSDVCMGLTSDLHGSVKHPILSWDGERVVATDIFRSPDCCIMGK